MLATTTATYYVKVREYSGAGDPSYVYTLDVSTATPTATPTVMATATAGSTATPTTPATSTPTRTAIPTWTPTPTPSSAPTPWPQRNVITYSYDGLQRLTQAVESPGATYDYAYDDAGNRTDVWLNSALQEHRTYDAANQVEGWAYDAAGNLVDTGGATYDYDALNRMTLRSTTPYTYNGDGALVDDGVTQYTQDLAAPLSQVLQTTQGGTTTNYLYGLDRLAAVAGSTRTWYGYDALGSVRMTLDDAGVPLGVVNYDPWGTVESGTVPTFGFTGEVQSGGLVNLRARWYSAGQGRFVTQDSFRGYQEAPYSMHPYQYGNSNPVLLTDHNGHCPAPPSDSGNVICVDLFIAAPSIGPMVPLTIMIGTTAAAYSVPIPAAVGDGRSFSANSGTLPVYQGGSRAYLYIYVDGCGQLTKARSFTNRSYVLFGLAAFGPYLQYDRFSAVQSGKDIKVDWKLLNGASGWARYNQERNLDAIDRTTDYVSYTARAAGAAFFAAAQFLIGLDSIDGTMTIGYDENTGVYNVKGLNRDPYPSMEVYYYHNGIQEGKPLLRHPETAAGAYVGLLPSAPRDLIP